MPLMARWTWQSQRMSRHTRLAPSLGCAAVVIVCTLSSSHNLESQLLISLLLNSLALLPHISLPLVVHKAPHAMLSSTSSRHRQPQLQARIHLPPLQQQRGFVQCAALGLPIPAPRLRSTSTYCAAARLSPPDSCCCGTCCKDGLLPDRLPRVLPAAKTVTVSNMSSERGYLDSDVPCKPVQVRSHTCCLHTRPACQTAPARPPPHLRPPPAAA